jgi:hypothetical protein
VLFRSAGPTILIMRNSKPPKRGKKYKLPPTSELKKCSVTGKFCYANSNQVRIHNKHNNIDIRPYLCQFCHKWHGTSQYFE